MKCDSFLTQSKFFHYRLTSFGFLSTKISHQLYSGREWKLFRDWKSQYCHKTVPELVHCPRTCPLSQNLSTAPLLILNHQAFKTSLRSSSLQLWPCPQLLQSTLSCNPACDNQVSSVQSFVHLCLSSLFTKYRQYLYSGQTLRSVSNERNDKCKLSRDWCVCWWDEKLTRTTDSKSTIWLGKMWPGRKWRKWTYVLHSNVLLSHQLNVTFTKE